MNRKRLFFVLPNLRTGGAERVTLTLMNFINQSSYDVTLIVLDPSRAELLGEVSDDLEILFVNKKTVKRSILKLLRIIISEKPDIVFTSLSHLNLALCIFKVILPRKTALVVRESNILSKNVMQFEFYRIFNILYKIFYRFADVIICQTSEMAADLLKNYNISEKKLSIIRNPVDVNRLKKLSGGYEKISKVNKKIVVACGRLDYQKGFDLLLEGFSLVSYKDCELWIIGDGPQKENLENIILSYKLENKVKLLGFMDNPYRHIKSADLFILSSRFEGMPNVVLEAISLGTPVLASSKISGMKELLKDEKSCILIDKVSPLNLAEGIEKFCFSDNWDTPSLSLIDAHLPIKINKKFEDILSRLSP